MMEETRKLPTVTGRKGPQRPPKTNLNIPSIFEVYGMNLLQHRNGEADNLIFFPLSNSEMADTSKLAKEWANS